MKLQIVDSDGKLLQKLEMWRINTNVNFKCGIMADDCQPQSKILPCPGDLYLK